MARVLLAKSLKKGGGMDGNGREKAAETDKITVEGVSLATYLGEKLGEAAIEEARETVIQKRRGLAQRVPARFAFGGKQGVETRARTWTPREIRRRYGIMKKPYKTMIENVLWCVLEKGPMTAKEIGEELGKQTGNVTSVLSAVRKLIPEVIGPDPETSPWQWRALKPMSPEAAYQRFLHARAEAKAGRKKAKEAGGQEPEDPVGHLDEGTRTVFVNREAVEALVVQALEEAIAKREGKGKGMDVRISHRIDVRFGILKEGE